VSKAVNRATMHYHKFYPFNSDDIYHQLQQ
jgi:hypothetical protein